ncbi:MAG: copper amine oxidase N-terminal domain-containing protein, partial [Firmicutes bacterium]|nr:copper amine oxidase N-terminal domain-containing protein [Bacillota bacterium]
ALKIGDNTMTVNGEEQTIDTAPVIIDSRTFVPVRAIVEALGGKVDWDAENKTAILDNGEDHIELTIDSKTAVLNSEEKTLDTAPVIIDSRTMLPLRFIAEGFGYKTDWDAETKTIYVSKSDEKSEDTKAAAPDNIGILKDRKQAIDSKDCDTFTQIVDKLADGQGYANITLGDTDAFLAAESVTDFDEEHNAAAAEIFIYENGEVKYLGSVTSGGTANPLAVKGGMLYTVGHHYIGKHTIKDNVLVTIEEAWETFDADGNVTYHSGSLDSDSAKEVYDELTEEYYETEIIGFDIIGEAEKEEKSDIPLKDNKEEAEYQIKVAMQKLFEEVYGDKVVDARISVDKIYDTKAEQEFETLKEMELGEDEVAFEVTYSLKPAEDATEEDLMLLTIPNGEYDEKTGWVTDCSRLGVLTPDGDGYTVTHYGTGW